MSFRAERNGAEESRAAAETPDHPAQATLLFGGDFCPKRRFESSILDSGMPFDDAIGRAFREADFSMVNLEAPLCASDVPPDNPNGHGLRADPRIAERIHGGGIIAVGLANNHIRDFGDEGVRQTMRSLEQHDVLHTGAGRNLAEAQEPLCVDVNGMKLGVWALAEKELNVASADRAGSSWLRPEQDIATVRQLREAFDFLVVFLHAGHEFILTPSPRIRTICRGFVDAGADAVIAHHPHVMQGTETYKGGLIAYSLGNLVFDSSYVSAYEHTDVGYLVQMAVSERRIHDVVLTPYRQGKDLVVRALASEDRDVCLRKLAEISANITDDGRFERAWEENVRFRWETEYGRVLGAFTEWFTDPENKEAARRARNFLTCPTHVEMVVETLSMLERGELPWAVARAYRPRRLGWKRMLESLRAAVGG